MFFLCFLRCCLRGHTILYVYGNRQSLSGHLRMAGYSPVSCLPSGSGKTQPIWAAFVRTDFCVSIPHTWRSCSALPGPPKGVTHIRSGIPLHLHQVPRKACTGVLNSCMYLMIPSKWGFSMTVLSKYLNYGCHLFSCGLLSEAISYAIVA